MDGRRHYSLRLQSCMRGLGQIHMTGSRVLRPQPVLLTRPHMATKLYTRQNTINKACIHHIHRSRHRSCHRLLRLCQAMGMDISTVLLVPSIAPLAIIPAHLRCNISRKSTMRHPRSCHLPQKGYEPAHHLHNLLQILHICTAA